MRYSASPVEVFSSPNVLSKKEVQANGYFRKSINLVEEWQEHAVEHRRDPGATPKDAFAAGSSEKWQWRPSYTTNNHPVLGNSK